MLSTIRQLESFLTAAIHLEGHKAHYKLLLAAIKSDYYACNGLRIPPPQVEQLLSDASRFEVDPREVRLLLIHLALPDGEILSTIRNYL